MTLEEQHDWLGRRISRRAVLGVGVGLGVAAVVTPSQRAAAATTPAFIGRQVVYGADPTRDITIAFAAASAFKSAIISVLHEGRKIKEARATIQMVAGTTTRYARAAFTGLQPGSAYDYHIAIEGRLTSIGSFATAVAGAHPFRFTAFGDQGTGDAPVRVLTQVERLKPSFHLFTGDLSYSDQSGLGGPGDVFKPMFWDVWMKQNDRIAAKTPWMCVPGNHEMEPGFALHGYAGMLTRVPIGGKSPLAIPVATTFRVGNVGFIGLDSNDVSYEIPANRGWTNDAQTRWLKQTLTDLRTRGSGVDFVVVFLHASPYSTNQSHASEGGIREAWVPLFDEFTVDLVISGHNHCYERTLPIRNNQPTTHAATAAVVDSSLGTTYLTAGGGGASTINYAFIVPAMTRVTDASGKTNERRPWRLASERNISHSVVCVDVAPPAGVGAETTMTLRTVDSDGHQLDSVVLRRTSTISDVSPRSAGSGSSALPWVAGGAAVAVVAAGVGAVAVSRHRSI